MKMVSSCNCQYFTPQQVSYYLTEKLQTKFEYTSQLKPRDYDYAFECHQFIEDEIAYRILALVSNNNDKYKLLRVNIGESVEELCESSDIMELKCKLTEDIYKTFHY
jgi:hypothetical protein